MCCGPAQELAEESPRAGRQRAVGFWGKAGVSVNPFLVQPPQVWTWVDLIQAEWSELGSAEGGG